jgi:hypothetical protein
MGDTAIFSDLKLQAELYQPTIGCIGIANPLEILHRFPMPGTMITAEMSPEEGALAARWLGLQTVFRVISSIRIAMRWGSSTCTCAKRPRAGKKCRKASCSSREIGMKCLRIKPL